MIYLLIALANIWLLVRLWKREPNALVAAVFIVCGFSLVASIIGLVLQ